MSLRKLNAWFGEISTAIQFVTLALVSFILFVIFLNSILWWLAVLLALAVFVLGLAAFAYVGRRVGLENTQPTVPSMGRQPTDSPMLPELDVQVIPRKVELKGWADDGAGQGAFAFADLVIKNQSATPIGVNSIFVTTMWWFRVRDGAGTSGATHTGKASWRGAFSFRPAPLNAMIVTGRAWRRADRTASAEYFDTWELEGLPEIIGPAGTMELPGLWLNVDDHRKATEGFAKYGALGGMIELRLTVRTERGTFQFPPSADPRTPPITVPISLSPAFVAKLSGHPTDTQP